MVNMSKKITLMKKTHALLCKATRCVITAIHLLLEGIFDK